MIRKATRADIPRIFEIRASVEENRLGDPAKVPVSLCEWFIDHAAIWLWDDGRRVLGFAAGDPRDGSIFALFVDPAHEGRGIGQTLLPYACATLREAGYRKARLATDAGTRADRFYRCNGWEETGRDEHGQVIFSKNL